MEQLSRRSFLRKGSTTVAAGALAATGLSKAASAAERSGSDDARLEGATGAKRSEPIVVYVADATKPEVRIMVGDREIVHRDASLVRTVVRASAS